MPPGRATIIDRDPVEACPRYPSASARSARPAARLLCPAWPGTTDHRCRSRPAHTSRWCRWSRNRPAPHRTGRTTGNWRGMLGRGTTRRCSLARCTRRRQHSSCRRGIGKRHRYRRVSHSTGRQRSRATPRISSSASRRSRRCTRKSLQSGDADTGQWSDTGRPDWHSSSGWRRCPRGTWPFRSRRHRSRSGCPRRCSSSSPRHCHTRSSRRLAGHQRPGTGCCCGTVTRSRHTTGRGRSTRQGHERRPGAGQDAESCPSGDAAGQHARERVELLLIHQTPPSPPPARYRCPRPAHHQGVRSRSPSDQVGIRTRP